MREPLPIELSCGELDALLKRVESGSLVAGDYKIIAAIVRTLKILSQAVDEKDASIQRLRQMIFGFKTETSKNVLPEPVSGEPEPSSAAPDHSEAVADDPETAPNNPRKAPGHGRNGAARYTGAVWIKVAHQDLKAGDPCPKCLKGKLYPLEDPKRGTVVRITGLPPIQGRVYDLEQLRCNLCGDVLSPELPAGAGPEKYDEKAGAMIALLKYGCGFPLYRIERLQESLGIPLAASTQWEILDNMVNPVHPAYLELVRQAARGKIIHNDDTTARILEMIAENKTQDEASRKGMFTTGIVSILGDIKIGLFFTGRNHAGENLSDLLALRPKELQPPIQMCDALFRNIPKDAEPPTRTPETDDLTLLANCLTHGRRQFVDITDNFPQECSLVIKILGKVYHNDSIAREQNLSPEQRLEFHQRESGPRMEELHTWLNRQFAEKTVEPNSGLGKAIKYMLKHWEALTLFLRVPGAPLDNNICERALKLAILHRKNSLFYKNEYGAYVGDIFMSLIHTCRLSKINPFDYLTALQKHATRVRQNPHLWLPWNYQTTLTALPP